MSDLYHINIEQITLDVFQQRLETSEPLPSRKILQQDTASRFSVIKTQGIDNMQQLWDMLKTPKRVEGFAQRTSLPLEFLTILRREIGSYLPNPVHLNSFPGIDASCLEKLARSGIKQNRQLLEQTRDETARGILSQRSGIPVDALMELVRMADYVRIPGVGPVFARMLEDVGCANLDMFCQVDAEPLFAQLMAINEGGKYTRSKFSEQHVKDCILIANMLPRMINY